MSLTTTRMSLRWQRILASLVGMLLALGGGLWAWLQLSPPVQIELGQAQIQQRLAERMPIQNCALLVCLELSQPQVSLPEGADRIHFGTQLAISLGQRKLTGSVAFSSGVRYVSSTGQFFLEAVQIEQLALQGFPPDFAEVVRVRGPGLVRLALEKHPIYTLRSDTTAQALARLTLQDVRVSQGRLRITLQRPPFL